MILTAFVFVADTLGSATVGLAFSNIIQMLVFYTWVVRFISESISLFNSVEGVSRCGSAAGVTLLLHVFESLAAVNIPYCG
jgi:hypothetical protein